MTVSTTGLTKTYTGDGVNTSFVYDFYIPTAADLVVILTDTVAVTDTTLTLNVDYTVSGAGDSYGGTVSYPVTGDPLEATETITIRRSTTLTQTTDLQNLGAYYPETLESTLDKLMMCIQETREITDRCYKTPETGYEDGAVTIGYGDARYGRLGSTNTWTGVNEFDAAMQIDGVATFNNTVNLDYYTVLGANISADDTYTIDNLPTPTAAKHAAPKSYVDAFLHETTGHVHDATALDGPKILATNLDTTGFTAGDAIKVKSGGGLERVITDAGADTALGFNTVSTTFITAGADSTAINVISGQKILLLIGFGFRNGAASAGRYKVVENPAGTPRDVVAETVLTNATYNEGAVFHPVVITAAATESVTYQLQVRTTSSDLNITNPGIVAIGILA